MGFVSFFFLQLFPLTLSFCAFDLMCLGLIVGVGRGRVCLSHNDSIEIVMSWHSLQFATDSLAGWLTGYPWVFWEKANVAYVMVETDELLCFRCRA